MAVCFFNKEYEEKYNCEYEKKENGIEIIVDYEINDETPSVNGVKLFGIDTKFAERDILIIDYKNRINYLLKNASYRGHTEVWGTPDGGAKTKFFANCYFAHNDYKKLSELENNSRVKKIKVYSNLINDIIGYPSLSTFTNNDEHVINLKKGNQLNTIEIDNHNIQNIAVGDCWYSKHSAKLYNIDIQLNGFIELELINKIKYEEVYDYIYELIIFIQLLIPDKFKLSKITVLVGDIQCDLHIPLQDRNYKEGNVTSTVNEDVLQFLKNCYEKLSYRDSKSEIRNIPYIILNTSRNLEDNFLMLYRFIECYYKDKGRYTDFISYSIKNNYKFKVSSKLEDLVSEIISLRNHYVHNGYFIKDNSLEITYKKIKGKKNPKDHIENNVDFDWIYNRTKILYNVVIDIIFSNMLGYKNYKFNRHF